ncbi:MAG: hypothetical protein ACOYLB_15355 [Phototrophicaceae bacterium]
MRPSRRAFLQGVASAMAGWFVPGFPNGSTVTLQRDLNAIIGEANIGIDVTRLLWKGAQLYEVYRIQHNPSQLFPSASCFKVWLTSYYYTFVPPDAWQDQAGTPLYNAIVNSNNTDTGKVLAEVGELQRFGNAIQKFNDYLTTDLLLQHGIYTWGWEGNPVMGQVDERFAMTAERSVIVRGIPHQVANVTTAVDMMRGYYQLLTRAHPADGSLRSQIASRALRLLSIPSDDLEYASPIERVVGRGGYIGKDGALPLGNLTAGTVLNDVGIVADERGFTLVAFLCVGESQFTAQNALTQTLDRLRQYEDEKTIQWTT